MTQNNEPTPEIEETLQNIVARLEETEEGAIRQIRMIVTHGGVDLANDLLNETLGIEEHGGMMTADGLRRRTPGGAFFYLAKGKLNPQLRRLIFPSFGLATRGAVIEWDERVPYFQRLMDENVSGWVVGSPRIILKARPRKWERLDNSVVMWFEHTPELGSYPHGVTQPPTDIKTSYSVYISYKQWERVEPIITRDTHDYLLIEGTCLFDPETQSVAIFALLVTTENLDKKNRKALMLGTPPYLSGDFDETTLVLPPRPSQLPTENKEKQQQKQAKQAKSQGQPARTGKPTGQHPSRPQEGNRQRSQPVSIPEPMVEAPAEPVEEVDSITSKLQQLQQAATTLRERIAGMEAKNQPGIAMTRKLLENTLKQIEALENKG